MTTTHPPTPEGPRTYQSAWQWNADGTAKLMTAEEWLEEEADVDAALDGVEADDVDDVLSRAGNLRAIAAEVAQLRREKTQWAEAATRKAAEIERLEAAVARRSPEGAEPTANAAAERDMAERALAWLTSRDTIRDVQLRDSLNEALQTRFGSWPMQVYALAVALRAAPPATVPEWTCPTCGCRQMGTPQTPPNAWCEGIGRPHARVYWHGRPDPELHSNAHREDRKMKLPAAIQQLLYEKADRIRALEQAFQRYADHDRDCDIRLPGAPGGRRCSCGYATALLAVIDPPASPTREPTP